MENFQLDTEYKQFIAEMKKTVVSARLKAVLSVNFAQIQLYWTIGQMILKRRLDSRWGSKVLAQISKDLKAEFPDMKGFSLTNLKYMKIFAQEYPSLAIGQQSIDQLTGAQKIIVKQPILQLPWGILLT